LLPHGRSPGKSLRRDSAVRIPVCRSVAMRHSCIRNCEGPTALDSRKAAGHLADGTAM